MRRIGRRRTGGSFREGHAGAQPGVERPVRGNATREFEGPGKEPPGPPRRLGAQWLRGVAGAAAGPLTAVGEGVVEPVPSGEVCVSVCGANLAPATLGG